VHPISIKFATVQLDCLSSAKAILGTLHNLLTRNSACRKFLSSTQNGAKSTAKQSTLAFNQKPAKPDAAEEDERSVGEDEGSDAEMQEAPKTLSTTNGNTADGALSEQDREPASPGNRLKREQADHEDQDTDDSDDQPVIKRRKRSSGSSATAKDNAPKVTQKPQSSKPSNAKAENRPKARRLPKLEEKHKAKADKDPIEQVSPEAEQTGSEEDEAESGGEEEEKPQVAEKKREALQSTLKSPAKDPYPDWKAGDPVPYAALCTTFSLIEMTTKRLQISAHCSLFLQQVLRLTPNDLLPTVQLMINKVAADYAGIELGIGESLIIKAISESTGRPLSITKSDHQKIGDLGLVAAKSRSTQGTMFKPKPLTVRGVHEGLLAIAKMEGHGSQDKKVGAIKKLLAAADSASGNKGIDINKDKGGASESKFLVRFLEGKLRLGLAEKTVIVALAQAMVTHEVGQQGGKVPSTDQLAKGESTLKLVYR
jgi:DNA ligase 1